MRISKEDSDEKQRRLLLASQHKKQVICLETTISQRNQRLAANQAYQEKHREKLSKSITHFPFELDKSCSIVTHLDQLMPSAFQLRNYEQDPNQSLWMHHNQSGVGIRVNCSRERMGDYLSLHPTVQYLNSRSDPTTMKTIAVNCLERVQAYREVVSHKQHIVGCGCCGVSRIIDPLVFTFVPVDLSKQTKTKPTTRPNSNIPIEFFDLRAELSALRLDIIDLDIFVCSFPEYTVLEWTFEFHILWMTTEYLLYKNKFLKTFDPKLYLGDSLRSVQYRSLFHYRSIFIDIQRTIDHSTCHSQKITSFSDDDDDEFVEIRPQRHSYNANAYFVIPAMVQFEYRKSLYTYNDINTVDIPDRVFSSVPYVSISDTCLEKLLVKHEKPKFSIANGFIDFGNYEDVPDVYGLFREFMHLVNGIYYRFIKLEPLSLFEQLVIAAVIVFGNIMKFVAPGDYGLGPNTARTLQIKGHIFSVANMALDTNNFKELNSEEYLRVQQLIDSLQVCIVCVVPKFKSLFLTRYIAHTFCYALHSLNVFIFLRVTIAHTFFCALHLLNFGIFLRVTLHNVFVTTRYFLFDYFNTLYYIDSFYWDF